MVSLMLLDGLRSCEILAIQLEDLKLADALLHVPPAARMMPLSPSTPAKDSENYVFCSDDRQHGIRGSEFLGDFPRAGRAGRDSAD